MKPKIVVFDEPTASLDPVSAQMLEETLDFKEKKAFEEKWLAKKSGRVREAFAIE